MWTSLYLNPLSIWKVFCCPFDLKWLPSSSHSAFSDLCGHLQGIQSLMLVVNLRAQRLKLELETA